MYVSQETADQTDERLRAVIAASDLVWYESAYAFEERAVDRFPLADIVDALAFVRDEQVWSVLKPAGPNAAETFGLFAFHFPDGMDNSGFVGWLASTMKQQLGTGVFVVCGQNRQRGGIFDYWGVPIDLKEEAAEVLDRLRAQTA
ncbi:MAG: hypothetical protein H0W74_05990 [Sphingosinicella sp.]|nr:hypothetical protein [Sphingosinicella sp.]